MSGRTCAKYDVVQDCTEGIVCATIVALCTRVHTLTASTGFRGGAISISNTSPICLFGGGNKKGCTRSNSCKCNVSMSNLS